MSRLPSSKRLQYPEKPISKIQYQSTSLSLKQHCPTLTCGKYAFISVEKYDITKKLRIKLHAAVPAFSFPVIHI
jgi:hypothetical protein